MPKTRLKERHQGGTVRYYADFRDFDDVGGGYEALRPEGQGWATDDPDEAAQLLAARLAELEEKRARGLGPEEEHLTLRAFAKRYLQENPGRVREAWLKDMKRCLRRAVAFFGRNVKLNEVRPSDVKRWIKKLERTPSPRGGTLAGSTIRAHLHALSGLYATAEEAELVPMGYNPVRAIRHKPSPARQEATWLEIHEAAALLEAARTYKPADNGSALPFLYPLLATFLLTGGRRAEILGLEVDDVSFQRRIITFRPNTWRPLKTRGSHRSVPLWPQLEEILREYLVWRAGALPVERLLFPSVSPRHGEAEKMIKDVRKALDAIGERAGFEPGTIRTKVFRHTYATARLQTLDHGAPVSVWTVAKELGHSSPSQVEQTYGHLGRVRHRSEVVEYRVEQHRQALRRRAVAAREEG